MFHSRVHLIVLVFILLFAASIASAGPDQPYTYKCDDGRQFTITFVKAKGEQFPMKAHLIFKKSKTVEVLENQMGASGSTYANKKYEFNEHHDDVTLTDFTKKNKQGRYEEIPCHETTR